MPVDRLPASSDASFTTTLRDSPSALKVTRWLWLICPVPTGTVSTSSTCSREHLAEPARR